MLRMARKGLLTKVGKRSHSHLYRREEVEALGEMRKSAWRKLAERKRKWRVRE